MGPNLRSVCGSHIRVSTELNSFRSHTYGASHVITQRARRERVCIYPETRLIKVYLIIIIPIHSFTLLSLYYVNYDFVITLLFIYLYTCMSFSSSIYTFKACILFSQSIMSSQVGIPWATACAAPSWPSNGIAASWATLPAVATLTGPCS